MKTRKRKYKTLRPEQQTEMMLTTKIYDPINKRYLLCKIYSPKTIRHIAGCGRVNGPTEKDSETRCQR